jgi:hypothetical protein
MVELGKLDETLTAHVLSTAAKIIPVSKSKLNNHSGINRFSFYFFLKLMQLKPKELQ